MGLKASIDAQLNPITLDDTATASRLARSPTLEMSSAQLLADFPPKPGDVRRRPQQIVHELSMANITRAIDSERQLEAVVFDFWLIISTSSPARARVRSAGHLLRA